MSSPSLTSLAVSRRSAITVSPQSDVTLHVPQVCHHGVPPAHRRQERLPRVEPAVGGVRRLPERGRHHHRRPGQRRVHRGQSEVEKALAIVFTVASPHEFLITSTSCRSSRGNLSTNNCIHGLWLNPWMTTSVSVSNGQNRRETFALYRCPFAAAHTETSWSFH